MTSLKLIVPYEHVTVYWIESNQNIYQLIESITFYINDITNCNVSPIVFSQDSCWCCCNCSHQKDAFYEKSMSPKEIQNENILQRFLCPVLIKEFLFQIPVLSTVRLNGSWISPWSHTRKTKCLFSEIRHWRMLPLSLHVKSIMSGSMTNYPYLATIKERKGTHFSWISGDQQSSYPRGNTIIT